MNAPLLIAERREARLLAKRAVGLAFHEQLGRGPRRAEPLYCLDRGIWLVLLAAIERRLGITFSDEDIEFVETEADLAERGALALMRRRA
jgi:hypothetical protein